MAGRIAAFTDAGAPFADFEMSESVAKPSLALGSQDGGLEAEMAGDRQGNSKWSGWWIGAFWFAGVAMFVVEWNAGLEYVQARLADMAPALVGYLPALALAALKLGDSAFWNLGHLEATFQVMPLVTIPFLLLGLGVSMRDKIGFAGRQRAGK